MNFKNDLERQCYEIAKRILSGDVSIEHNKKITIESALFPEVASFKGPPAKEIDVLVAQLLEQPKIVLLVSCKQFTRRAEPAHVQEWAAVVQTMNKYSNGTIYFGLLISPTGYTSGCEAWATTHNLGIIPPLKGRRLAFNKEAVFRMFERLLIALQVRVRIQVDDLEIAPNFFEFVYRLVADFEGHQDAVTNGRYFLAPQGWVSSFGEMYSIISGKKIEDAITVDGACIISLSGGVALRFNKERIDFGIDPRLLQGSHISPDCRKNIEMEACTFDLIKTIAVGKLITSAGDFGDYVEIGLDQMFNLGLHQNGFHLISTENPIEEHRL